MMQFVEFLEFISRIAHVRYRYPDPNSALELSQKIEIILNNILSVINYNRRDVDLT
jgi:hypothetical protein